MEEADSLLLSSLSPALKLLPAPAPNVSTLQSLLSLNLLYPVVSASLSVLDGGDVEELPKTTSKKHRACAKMAERVKGKGRTTAKDQDPWGMAPLVSPEGI